MHLPSPAGGMSSILGETADTILEHVFYGVKRDVSRGRNIFVVIVYGLRGASKAKPFPYNHVPNCDENVIESLI